MFIQLTHSNNQAKISVVKSQIFAVYFSLSSKSTHVVSNAGGVVPVAESVDEVKAMLAAPHKEGEAEDGVRTEAK